MKVEVGELITGSHGERGVDACRAWHSFDMMLVEDLEGHGSGALDGNR